LGTPANHWQQGFIEHQGHISFSVTNTTLG